MKKPPDLYRISKITAQTVGASTVHQSTRARLHASTGSASTDEPRIDASEPLRQRCVNSASVDAGVASTVRRRCVSRRTCMASARRSSRFPQPVTMDNPLCCEISPESQGRLNTILDCFITSLCQEHEAFNEVLSSNSESHLGWRNQLYERLCQSYLLKRKGHVIAEDDTLEDLKWDLRQLVVKNIGTSAVVSAELDYTMGIIKEDAYNRHAWSHRQWVLQTLIRDWVDEDGTEIEFCRKILDKDSCNSYAWDQRCFVVTRWLPIIEAATRGDELMETGDDVFEKFGEHELSMENLISMEIDYAIKVIGTEPENQFPWCHINVVCSVYPTSCGSGPKVRDAILRVLQGARDCVLGLDAVGEGIMGGRVAASLINARGVMNALNMLRDIYNYRGGVYDIKGDEEEKYRDAPVIIFVEDFDLFAGVRGKFIHTKKQDHESFINQLLVELDGFEKQDGVVLMATTRNLKQIDEALQRPGRMDRIFHLQQPTQAEREKILRMAAKETMDEDLIDFVDWQKLARVQCAGNPHFWVNKDGSYQEEGQKNTKGYIWEKDGTKLLCAILSLRVPSKSSQPCGEQATSMNSRSLPDYLEQRAIQKLLLIGYNGSETSTIFKQARVIYKDAPFSVDEREHIKLFE
ncbi:extra-large guanine nucleotide-binding protein 1 [Phtheirospermum japonicum]|uniref:Extra-large guanine nucleotide-binding protein 1 n=1 Tax=Phtheirospermum japonicum TaxID=374723 RepID=A0A830CPR8_9LAMI|nr:extra-large guanine nucleotide-binding protein 1 [Phtheirospermum japonicum]